MKPTIGKVEFGPGREPPPEVRMPTGELRDCTVVGEAPLDFLGWRYAGGTAYVYLENLEPWARAALERGLKAMQEDVL